MKSNQIKLKVVATILIITGLFISCNNQPKPAVTEILMAPLEVGTKTPDYEVISPSELKLSPGVKIKHIKGANGEDKGFVLLRADGSLGGYMVCECSGATSGNCTTENDNPEHASCSGGCNDSEGNPAGCSIAGPLPGPPRDPFVIRFVDRKTYEKSLIDR